MKNKSKIAKKCKECKKLLRDNNKSGLCSYHNALNWSLKKLKGGKKNNVN